MTRLNPRQIRAFTPWRDVRFGSKADMCSAQAHVRYVPLTSDLRLDAPQQSSLRYSMTPAAAYAI